MLKTDDGSIQKLRQIVANRYGKGLELRTLTDVSVANSQESLLLKGEDLHIPLRVQNAFLGTAVILNGAELEGDKRSQVAQMVRMVLEPSLYRDYLERHENNLKTLAENDNLETDNLRVFAEPEVPSLIGPEVTSGPSLVSNLLHLRAHDGQRMKKAALLMHEMTSRWAFVPFADLSNGLESVEDLIKLGALTIYIESVEKLAVETQALILEYISSPRANDEPLVITGTTMTIDDLAKVEALSSEFREELSVNCLDLDRAPLTERGLKEMLSLMFFATRGEA